MEIKQLKPPLPEYDAMEVHFDRSGGEWVANFSFADRVMTLCLGFFHEKAEKEARETADLLRQLIFHSIPVNSSNVEEVPREFALSGNAIGTEDILEQEIATMTHMKRCFGYE